LLQQLVSDSIPVFHECLLRSCITFYL